MFAVVANAVRSVAADKKGAALVEYGLLVGFIAVVCIVAIQLLGTQINGLFGQITAAL
jgi:pilus assembly protein Flp/PilA